MTGGDVHGVPGPVGAAMALVAGATACLFAPALVPASAIVMAAAMVASAFATRRAPRAAGFAALFAVAFAWTTWHVAATRASFLPAELEGATLRVTGRVVELPVVEPRRVRFLLRVDDDPSNAARLRGGLLRLAWYHHGDAERRLPHAGSRWTFDLRLRAPRGLRNPGGLDAERYALAQRIVATGYVRGAGVERVPPAGIDAWRERMSARIHDTVASPTSRFVRALALGDTRGLDDGDWAILRATGLTHLIAISGFHVGLVAGFFAFAASLAWRLVPWVALRCPRPLAMAMAAVSGAALYTAVAGFALPTVRTTLMIAAVAFARCTRRPLSIAASLALAVIAMLALDPLSLLGAGFWLSVGGVACLAWCLPRDDASLLRTFASAQVVATIGLFPITVAWFGQASFAGPFANLVAVPWWSLVVVPLALLGTALDAVAAGTGGWAWRAAALAFDATWPAFVRLGESTFAFRWMPEARWFALPLASIGALWLLLPRGVPGKPLAALLWLPLLWPSRALPSHGAFRMDVLDVGQGLSVLVRTTSHAVLFDMGPAMHAGYDAGERAVVPALRALGVRTLDLAIASHADSDHAGGWEAVHREIPVRLSHAPPGSPTPATARCIAGRAWHRDGVTFRYLHPTPHFPYLGNEAGCVLRIEGPHGAALLTGDIGEVVERTLVRRDAAAVRADVVLVPHHGSEGSSDPAFIQAADARFALVSAGAGNRFGHPRPDIVSRWCRAGTRVLNTAEGGALRVEVGKGGARVFMRRATHARVWDALPRSARNAGLCYRPD